MNEQWAHPDGANSRNGLVLARRAGESVSIFFEDTETLLEVKSISHYPKSVELNLISPQIDWRSSSAPREPVGRFSMTELDAVHLLAGDVSVRIFCSMIDRNQTKLVFKSSRQDVSLYRSELRARITEERKQRGIRRAG